MSVDVHVHVHAPGMHVDATDPAPARWCFACRKRLPGTWSLWVEDDPLGWYGPHWAFTCDGCGQDRRLGFGLTPMVWL